MKIGRILGWLAVPAIAAGVWYGWQNNRQNPAGSAPEYRTDTVRRGDLVDFISATGTIEPEELVDVGAQVGGMVTKFGLDTAGKEIDYGSTVKAGVVLAAIDDALFVAEVRQAEAQLAQARANLLSNEATLKQLTAREQLAVTNYERAKRLRPSGAVSQSDYDNAKAELDVAAANLAVGRAAIEQSKAAIASAEASRDRAQRNLGYCTISSPVDGVVIDRQVNIGQTVNASMNAPSLFLIAKDLRRMEIWVSVNEADIGRVSVGQKTTFTVDAFPGRTFFGKVSKIRLNASMSQNVVTYVVEVTTDNSDLKLLPYLTASVKFIIAERQNVLSVPNAALRVDLRPDGETSAAPTGVWLLEEGGRPRFVPVSAGLNDGVRTEISGDGLTEGAAVVTGVSSLRNTAAQSDSAASGGSPFLPKPPQRQQKKSAQ